MGDRPRFYLPRSQWEPGPPSLSGDEAKHCSRVLRMEAGDELEIFDGEGRSARAVVQHVTNQSIALELIAPAVEEPVRVPILLAAAIPKGQTMEDIIRQATEIGATRIVPLLTERCVVKVDDPNRRREKWQRVALEACKQCGRQLDAGCGCSSPAGCLFCRRGSMLLNSGASPPYRTRRHRWCTGGRGRKPPSAVSVLTGPEGDFTPRELEKLIGAGYRPLWLGPHILRADTAAAYALSILSQKFLFL